MSLFVPAFYSVNGGTRFFLIGAKIMFLCTEIGIDYIHDQGFRFDPIPSYFVPMRYWWYHRESGKVGQSTIWLAGGIEAASNLRKLCDYWSRMGWVYCPCY